MSFVNLYLEEEQVLTNAQESKQKFCDNYYSCHDCPLYNKPCRTLGDFITSIENYVNEKNNSL